MLPLFNRTAFLFALYFPPPLMPLTTLISRPRN